MLPAISHHPKSATSLKQALVLAGANLGPPAGATSRCINRDHPILGMGQREPDTTDPVEVTLDAAEVCRLLERRGADGWNRIVGPRGARHPPTYDLSAMALGGPPEPMDPDQV